MCFALELVVVLSLGRIHRNGIAEAGQVDIPPHIPALRYRQTSPIRLSLGQELSAEQAARHIFPSLTCTMLTVAVQDTRAIVVPHRETTVPVGPVEQEVRSTTMPAEKMEAMAAGEQDT